MVAPSGAAAVLAILLLPLMFLPSAVAAPMAPSGPLEALMLGLAPTGPRQPSAVDAVFDTRRVFSQEESSRSDADLDERSVLNAIGLGRRSGSAFGPEDVMDQTSERQRRSLLVQGIIPDPDDILAALTLGVRVDASLLDIPFAETFLTKESTTAERRLGDVNALSGVALHANGIALDPLLLVDRDEKAERSTTWGSASFASVSALGGPQLTTRDVVAAAAIAQVDEPIPLVYTPSTSALLHEGRAEHERQVELPESRALVAIALANRGMPVHGPDLLDVRERLATSTVDTTRTTYEREDVLFALLLGMTAADQ